MICGSEHFYKKCIARHCKICGAEPEAECSGEPWLERFVHMQRAPIGSGKATNTHDPMLHKGMTGLRA